MTTVIDGIDELILSTLSRNSKQDTKEIWAFLRDYGHSLTNDEIESRVRRLEEDHIITRYIISVDTDKINRLATRVLLLRFRTSQHLPSRLEGLKKYFTDAPFVLFFGRTRGGYDWTSVQSFLTQEMADQESDIFRSLFGDIIQSYDVYDFISVGELSVHAFAYSIEEYEKFLKQWVPSSSERYDNNKALFS